jgi:hypothetical protein
LLFGGEEAEDQWCRCGQSAEYQSINAQKQKTPLYLKEQVFCCFKPSLIFHPVVREKSGGFCTQLFVTLILTINISFEKSIFHPRPRISFRSN